MAMAPGCAATFMEVWMVLSVSDITWIVPAPKFEI